MMTKLESLLLSFFVICTKRNVEAISFDYSLGWVQQTGSTAIDQANAVATSTDGLHIYVTGVTYGNLNGLVATNTYRGFLVQYNALGTLQWTTYVYSTLTGATITCTAGYDILILMSYLSFKGFNLFTVTLL